MHGYRYGFEFAEPVSMVLWVFWYENFRSGEWSYDLVDSLTTLNYTIKTTTTINTTNHCLKHDGHSMAQMTQIVVWAYSMFFFVLFLVFVN
jgi:hypothetical protein